MRAPLPFYLTAHFRRLFFILFFNHNLGNVAKKDALSCPCVRIKKV